MGYRCDVLGAHYFVIGHLKRLRRVFTNAIPLLQCQWFELLSHYLPVHNLLSHKTFQQNNNKIPLQNVDQ